MPAVPGLFVTGAITGPGPATNSPPGLTMAAGPQRGDKGRTTMAATIGPGGPAMADSHAINGPAGLTLAAIIGRQRGGGLTMAGADQLWQPQSVWGTARQIGPPGPTVGGTS